MARLRVRGTSSAVNGGMDDAKTAAHDAAPWIVRMARVGYAAKGTVYLVIGGLATRAALGAGGGTTDSRGALAVIGQGTAGGVILGAIAAGLLGYTLWALIAAATDADRRGPGAKGAALRVGQAFRGLVYGGLGIEAARLAIGGVARGGDGTDHWTGELMAAPMGRWLVAGVGIAVAGYALYQFWRAARKDLQKRLHMSEAGADGARWVLRLARFGIAARAVVLLLIGWFLLQASGTHDPSRAGGVADSLVALAAAPYGPIALGTVALGLMAYGIWELANARYRAMRVG